EGLSQTGPFPEPGQAGTSLAGIGKQGQEPTLGSRARSRPVPVGPKVQSNRMYVIDCPSICRRPVAGDSVRGAVARVGQRLRVEG
ncbi:MAG: hypothetical protein KAG66_19935, partial [Methylococcales bacterium]|nr:hypothetical protein [Methylococcales bacterium]